MNSHLWHKLNAKAKLTVKAKSEAGIFEESLHALYDFMNPTRGNAVAPIINLDLKGQDMPHLLDEFISTILNWTTLHKAHYHTFVIHSITHNHLVGVLEGNAADKFEHLLKTASHKPAHIDHKEGRFNASIEFDV